MEKGGENLLVNDIHRVLKYEVQFSSAFAMSMVISGCPNPGLDVEGVGRVPLPLIDQTAQLIASVGDQAPYGRGTDTVVDTSVRDTIQIDASDVRFLNPKWVPFIQSWVEKEVWDGLGCAPFTSPPRCELYKLLLYKPGAHFLAHKDTEKAPGMFATLVIVLPSEYTGGEIHLSHGGETMVFDNANDSLVETTSLAWYTDVTHEVKEIASGHRLALSYNLINTSPGIIPPHIPSDHSSFQRLREVFSRWSNDEYLESGSGAAVAYVFSHEYSHASLQEVIFKGEDQQVASMLKCVGDAEGIAVFMGWLNVAVQGYTGDDGWETYQGYPEQVPDYGDTTGTYESPVMSQVHETNIWVEELRDMQGKRVGIAKIKLDDENVLPLKAFRGVRPEESKMGEGYFGNEGAPLEFMYKCAALVMFPRAKQLSVMLFTEGPTWALEELAKSRCEGRTKENEEIVGFLVRQRSKETIDVILEIAIEWKDVALWGQVVELHPRTVLRANGYADLSDGWKAFGLDGVRPTFEKLFRQRGGLESASMRFLLFVKEKLRFGEDEEEGWISDQAACALKALSCGEVESLVENGVMMSIVRWQGLEFASSVVLPRLAGESQTLGDITEFGVELVKRKEELIGLPRVEGQTTSNGELLNQILDKIVETVASRVWQNYRRDQYHLRKVLLSLVSICASENRMESYGKLLERLLPLSDDQSFYARYRDVYEGLIPGLTKKLKELGVSVWTSPSREFFHEIIGRYLEEVVGSREGSRYLKFPILGCEHEWCRPLEEFLRSEERCLRVEGGRQNCSYRLKLDGGYELLEAKPLFGMRVAASEYKKKHEALAVQYLSVRVADARKLLESIGTEEDISRIMGERYLDVEKALEGSQAFVHVRKAGTGEGMVGME